MAGFKARPREADISHMRRALPTLVLLGWVLLYADGRNWKVVDDFPYQTTCLRVLSANVDREVRDDIGSALADQPADNPIRQQAYARAERRAGERYRCEWRGE